MPTERVESGNQRRDVSSDYGICASRFITREGGAVGPGAGATSLPRRLMPNDPVGIRCGGLSFVRAVGYTPTYAPPPPGNEALWIPSSPLQ
jgi:hypothetical protein